MTVLEILDSAIRTLNDIHVKGETDMRKMLGVMSALSQLRDYEKHSSEEAEKAINDEEPKDEEEGDDE